MPIHHKIGVDLDGVLCEFNHAYARLLAQAHGKDLLPPDWPENREVFCCWGWDAYYGYPVVLQDRVWQKHIQGNPLFWESLGPMAGAKETLKKLNSLAEHGEIDCYFITNRRGTNVKLQSEWWLYKHGFNLPTVLLASDKVPIIRSLGLSVYVDDKIETMLELVATSEKEKWLHGTHFYLVDAPWNREGRTVGLQVVNSAKQALEDAVVWV